MNNYKMDELKNNMPDDVWRKAFEEAAETPPARVWDSIERRLDESNGPRIIPLWGSGLASSRPVVWGTGMAAALALLLVGWWAINTQSASQTQSSNPSRGSIAVAPTTPIETSTNAGKSSAQVSDVTVSVTKPSETLEQSVAISDHPLSTLSAGGSTEEPGDHSGLMPDHKLDLLSRQAAEVTTLRTSPVAVLRAASTTDRMAVTSFTSNPYTATVDIVSKQVGSVAFGQITGKPLRLRSAGPIQRIVWFQSAELPIKPELTDRKRRMRDTWASASVMPGAFNPAVLVRSVQPTFNNTVAAYTANTNQSAVSSRANFSVAYQASAGVQLTDRWSVESGIGYLAARSTVETPAQVTTTNFIQSIRGGHNTTVSNLYVDALQSSSSNKALNTATAANYDILAYNNAYLSQKNYDNQTRQTLTNDYQYVQVPIQVGYQLRPRKRLSLAVLGGLLTNIFVRNTVGTDVVVTAKDGVYRPVSLAATMGARFRYRPSGRWSASLAGLYQPSLESSTQTDSPVEVRPTSTGMSFGVDYHF